MSIILVTLAQRKTSTKVPAGYVKVQSYIHVEPGDATCAADTPSCGVCGPEGKIIDKQCYVPEGSQFSDL